MTAAAFFDLDRTLLPNASGHIFGKHLATEGLSTGADIPGAHLLVGIYDLFGETSLNMQVTKRLVKAASGWQVEAVERAAKNAAQDLADAVPAYAKQIIEEHRAAGLKLVIATTSPTVLVGPAAEALGFDDVIGTEWSHDGHCFDGGTVGPFVWGTEKRDAIARWASEHEVRLTESFGYSDSYYDGSMLDAVGNAVAVNPDARLAGVAALKGWPIRYFDAPPGVLKVLGMELQEWMRPFIRPELVPMARWNLSGLDNIPEQGPAILAFNHRSYFDSAAMAVLVNQTGRACRFLAKREMFDTPFLGPLTKLVGGIRVDRGTGSSQPLAHAVKALTAGEMVAIAPQGTIPRGPDFFEPVLKGRPGAAQLAIESGAPILPVALWGTEKVWPRNQKVPKPDPRNRPEVSVTVGAPVDIKRRSAKADTVRIMDAISDLLPPEAREHRTPTEEELARTYPAGKGPSS